jgi:hypothetical protein
MDLLRRSALVFHTEHHFSPIVDNGISSCTKHTPQVQVDAQGSTWVGTTSRHHAVPDRGTKACLFWTMPRQMEPCRQWQRPARAGPPIVLWWSVLDAWVQSSSRKMRTLCQNWQCPIGAASRRFCGRHFRGEPADNGFGVRNGGSATTGFVGGGYVN